MRVLILGGNGMLGHQLLLYLQKYHEVSVTLRNGKLLYDKFDFFNEKNSYFNINLLNDSDIKFAVSDFKPEAVINAGGITKHRSVINEQITHLEMNAILPHRLVKICNNFNARLIHISTDCVFSGEKGKYREEDLSDAKDLYGKTKYLGEVTTGRAITLRTSLIGLELSRNLSLIEWYLSSKGRLKGYNKAIFTGLTTYEMSKVIHLLLTDYNHLSGLWNIASQPITKYELLLKLTHLLNRNDIHLEKDEEFFCDRSLISDKFFYATSYTPPSWDDMLNQLIVQINNRKLASSFHA